MSRKNRVIAVRANCLSDDHKVIRRLYTEEALRSEIRAWSDRYAGVICESKALDFRDCRFLDALKAVKTEAEKQTVRDELIDEIYEDILAGIIVYCDNGRSKLIAVL